MKSQSSGAGPRSDSDLNTDSFRGREQFNPAEKAVQLAETLLRDSLAGSSSAEESRMNRMAALIEHPNAKWLSLLMTDRIGRSSNAERTARAWRAMTKRFGIGDGFSAVDRFLIRLGCFASRFVPGLVIPAVQNRLRAESRDVILPAEDKALARYIEMRETSGARVNLNQLGEAVLGEEEAENRLAAVLSLLERDDVECVSVKISALFSQINLTAWDESLSEIKDRLRIVFRAAQQRKKMVNLDMEEYSDLELTTAAFKQLLSEDEFRDFSAGIALQAYLPDSLRVQRELTKWARERISRGGVPVKIRLVKGANLAMEQVDAEWHGWRQAPHPEKAATDAAFKQMLEFACQPDNAAAVRTGVGSHNLFDIALALVLREENQVRDSIEIEMLEGMAPAQSQAVQDAAGGLLVYAPVVHEKDYGSALAYLIRRLDENTQPGNFLANLFSLRPGSTAWEEERDKFLAAWEKRHQVSDRPCRATLPGRAVGSKFGNEPDTDWTQPMNRNRLTEASADREAPPTAGEKEIESALALASASQAPWEAVSENRRARLLGQCADQIAEARFDLIALIRDEGKKAAAEADSEVSEAVDFARYYAVTGKTSEGLQSSALGTVAVVPPWNFPLAIPCGGILAALMAGNTVVVKPAPEAVRTCWRLVNLLWQAGIPREALHFVACPDGAAGKKLIEDPRLAAVILTGSIATGRLFRQWRPTLPLFAETSGKNGIIVTAMADRELAAKDLAYSAFGHSGQKCSAASLGILEAEVYDDAAFRRQLRDAAASFLAGEASDPCSKVTPLVQAPGDDLLRALTTLELGEEWLLEPRVSPEDPCLWTPGIKLGVQGGSWFHRTECFGPVIGLMRAKDLDEAISLQNGVEFGLTAGIHSLDEEETEYWKSRVEAGNLYINRGITGAIVGRQPFGGWKQSSIGPGAKAGGPNYVNLFRRFGDEAPQLPGQVRASYEEAWENHFSRRHDPGALRCESNEFLYRSRGGVLLRLPRRDRGAEWRAGLASDLCGVPLVISRGSEESEAELAERLPELIEDEGIELLRGAGDRFSLGETLLRAAAEVDLDWINTPLCQSGRIELTRWLREQTVSEIRHRYGNVITYA